MTDEPAPQQSNRIERTIFRATFAIGGIGSFLTALVGVSDQVKKSTSLFKDLPSWVSLLAAAALFVLCVWAFGKSRRRSVLLRPEALRLERDRREHLVGREDDIEALSQLSRQHPLVFLEGESGAGKSALLQAGLVPDLANDTSLLPVYVQSIVGMDWERDPRLFLRSALLSVLGEHRDKISPTIELENLSLADGLAAIQTKISRRALVILDQFDDYQTRHRDKFLHRKTWLNPEGLCNLNSFWSELRALVEAGTIHLLIVTRADTAGGLASVRFSEPETYRLDRLSNQFVGPLLERLEHGGGEQVVADPEFGWKQLRDRLESDLEEDGTVLPQQLKVVLAGLGSFPRRELTPGAYERIGGVRGIEAGFIEAQIAKVGRLFSLSANNLRTALLSLVDTETKEKTVEQPQSKLAELIGGSADRAIEALSELERCELARKRESPNLSEPTWSLDHDYLARAVIKANKQANRWMYRLAEGAKALASAGSPAGRWRALLPIGTQIAFCRDRFLGRFHYDNYKGYAAISMVRLVPYILVVTILVSGTFFELQRREFLRVQRISDAILNVFDRDGYLSDREMVTLLRLHSAEPSVRKYVTTVLLTDSDRTAIFLANPREMTRALTGVSPTFQTWLKMAFHMPEIQRNPESPALLLTRILTATNSGVADELSFDEWLRATTATEEDVGDNFTNALVTMTKKLTDAQAAEAIAPLLKAIDSTTDADALQALGSALGAMPVKLTDAQAAEAIAPFVKALGSRDRRDYLQTLGVTLRAVMVKLTDAQAAEAAVSLVKAIGSTTNGYALQALATGLGPIPVKLTDAQTAEATMPFLKAIGSTTDGYALQALATGLVALPWKLTDAQATEAIAYFLETIGGSTSQFNLGILGSGLATLITKLTGVQTAEAIAPFIKAINSTTNMYALEALGAGLVAMSGKLTEAQAAEATVPFLKALGGTTDIYALQALALGLGALPGKLTEAQAADATAPFIKAINSTTNARTLRVLGSGLGAIAAKLTDAQAAEAIAAILNAIGTTTDAFILQTLGTALGMMPVKLTDTQANEAIASFIKAIDTANSLFALQALSSGLSAMPVKLTDAQAAEIIALFIKPMRNATESIVLPDIPELNAFMAKLTDAQAAEAIMPFLRAIGSTTDADALLLLGSGLGAATTKLTDAQAAETIVPLIEAMGRTTNAFKLRALGSGLGALPVKLTETQAAEAIAPFINAIGNSTDVNALRALDSGVGAIAAKLTDEQLAEAIALPSNFSHVVAGLSNPLIGENLERTLLRLLETQSHSNFQGDVWRAVKWIKMEQSNGRLTWLDLDKL
ncbi:hypothetical protein AB9F35_20110 [Rhizobium leguminosarum]|uniref:nSTAND1 domain-containing NTPase n=1 Tax=Rhizobium leguminosarum TaxID=384 RepID=UPI003F99E713